jgi:2-polyprenyl-3-methyl-5-hydroxy-6-metoxy-1,4-benzoquinol methylase
MISNCNICESLDIKPVRELYDDRHGYPDAFTLFECNSCGHRTLDAAFSPDEIVALYSNYYPRSNLKIEDFRPLSFSPGFRAWLKGEFRAYAAVPPDVRVLDIGCGLGESLAYHKSRGCEAHGVDADDNLLRTAAAFNLRARVGVFDANDYETGYFDFVTMDQVIEHAPDPVDFLRQVTRVMKSSAKLCMTTPNAGGWGARFFGNKWIHWHTPYHLNLFTRRSMKLALDKAGLKLIASSSITSSNWLGYQWRHNVTFPERSTPSKFWTKGIADDANQETHFPQWIEFCQRWKLHILTTRFMDALGIGDNLYFEAVPRG